MKMNYLAMDRPDLQYAAKEACRHMSRPTRASIEKLRRIAKYLMRRPRLVWTFEMQELPKVLDVQVDANWAGCRISRKSTSGGSMMWGLHCVKTWSKTQANIAKSSAESELQGVIRGACEGLGASTLIKELGEENKVRIHIDASAAKAIVERTGLQKVRHLEVDRLWLQEQQARRILPLSKVLGTKNAADMMTKNVAAEVIEGHTSRLCLEFQEGRARTAVQLHGLRAKRCRDSWNQVDKNKVWTRRHVEWRRTLFTPYGMRGSPSPTVPLTSVRETVGITEHGQEFNITDNWMNSDVAHRDIGLWWRGTTSFSQVQH